jgi:hypothetical protein
MYLYWPGEPLRRTQAETVTAGGSSEGLAGTRTTAVLPSNARAPLRLPAIQLAPPSMMPLLPVPDASAAELPLPSSKRQCATGPLAAPAGVLATSFTAPTRVMRSPFRFMCAFLRRWGREKSQTCESTALAVARRD